jgi:hypothetical protein
VLILAEDLLLLALDDETGRSRVDGSSLPVGLGGAVLLELALAGRVEVEKQGGVFSRERVLVRDSAPLDDPVLTDGLALVGEKPRSPQDLVNRLGKGLQRRLQERLAERGVLRQESGRLLGIFPHERWPADDSRHEDEVRRRLHEVLVVGTTPDERTAALVALLSALDHAHKVLEGLDGPARRAVRRRAKEVAEGAWAADAVRGAIQAMQAAVLTAVTAAGASTAASTS